MPDYHVNIVLTEQGLAKAETLKETLDSYPQDDRYLDVYFQGFKVYTTGNIDTNSDISDMFNLALSESDFNMIMQLLPYLT